MQRADLMYRDGLLEGERILITGGGTGLGRVMAEAFAMLGAHVYICGRRAAALDQAKAAIEAAHAGVIEAIVCDIRQPESIETMLESIWRSGGPLTGLVNNAAGNFISRTEDLSIRAFDAISSIVFRGTFTVTHACGRRWLAEGCSGTVLSILATWVWNGSPFVVPSAMSKAGVHAMTQSLAVEWGHRGIRLNAIAPGPFPTEGMVRRLAPGSDVQSLAASRFSRVGRLPELANLAVYLMARESSFVNGQTVAIDGAEFQASGGNFSRLRDWDTDQWLKARQEIERQNELDRVQRGAG